MGLDLSNNNAAYAELMAHAGHELTIGVNGDGEEVDISCEDCGEVLVCFGKPGIRACARCGSPLHAEDGTCYDETCAFSETTQDDYRGWYGHPMYDHYKNLHEENNAE